MFVRWLLTLFLYGVIQLGLYVGMFFIFKPKYTFLAGNNYFIISILLGLLIVAALNKFKFNTANFFIDTNSLIIATLLNYALHSTIFITIERSISINILEYLSQGKPHTYEEIINNFHQTFIDKDLSFCQRLDEQTHLKNIELTSEGYIISAKGLSTLRTLQYAKRITRYGKDESIFQCQK